MELIRTRDLKPGMIVAKSILDSCGRTLVSQNIVLTALAIRRLKELGIDRVYIGSEGTEGIDIKPAIEQNTKEEAARALKTLDIDKVIEVSRRIVEEMSRNITILSNMDMIKTYDDYTYQHSIGVAMHSSMIGIGLGYNKTNVERLVSAALLHDIGKTCIDDRILNAPRKLTEDEYNEIKKHTVYGYKILEKRYELSATVKTSVLLHHENEDGTGYPRGFRGDEIFKFAQIIHICDVYDALITKRPYKDAMFPKDAMQYIESKAGEMFSKPYVNVFKTYTPIYEVGTVVKLSNGSTGIVVKNYSKATSRPTVRINGKDIDLRKPKFSDIYIIE